MTELSYYDTVILSMGSLFLGIVMLIKGGNWSVDAAVYVANRFGISPMVVGFTIIAFGTSLPELIVSVFANLQGSPGIAIGNVLGSNIANILLVLGVAAFFGALQAKVSKALVRDLSFMVLSTVSFALLLQFGGLTRSVGFLMLAVLGAYVFYQYLTTDDAEFEGEDVDLEAFRNDLFAYATLMVGLICIAIGAEFLVKGAKVSAGLIGVPESVIALSIIAFGTSLPELSTSVIAARKGQAGMVIGNIIGSNVFNILMIIGVSAAIKPILSGSFSPELASFDSWVTLIVAVALTAILLIRGKISRVAGVLFFLSYIAYNAYIYMSNI
ncbi:MAG: calcium/sodium antiporter [Alphaproteobacteria bacterium]